MVSTALLQKNLHVNNITCQSFNMFKVDISVMFQYRIVFQLTESIKVSVHMYIFYKHRHKVKYFKYIIKYDHQKVHNIKEFAIH